MPISLRYSLQAQARYFLGEPIGIGFTLESLASTVIWVLKWYTPLEGIKGKILQVSCDGVDVPYEGRLVKRGSPSREDYVRLQPGASVSAEFDLANCYSLGECNECRVTFKGRIHDVVTSEQGLPPAAHEPASADASGSPVSFRIDK
jgi:hypothetical protein